MGEGYDSSRIKMKVVARMMKEEQRKTSAKLLQLRESLNFVPKKIPPFDEKTWLRLGNQGVDMYGIWPTYTESLLKDYSISEEETKYSFNTTYNELYLTMKMYMIEKLNNNIYELQMKLEFVNPVIGTDGIRIRMGHFFFKGHSITIKDRRSHQEESYQKIKEDDEMMQEIIRWLQNNHIQLVVDKFKNSNEVKNDFIFDHELRKKNSNTELLTSNYQIETQNGLQQIDNSFQVYLRIENQDIPAGIVLPECKYQISYLKQHIYDIHQEPKKLIGETIVYFPLVLGEAILKQQKWRKYSLQPEEASLIPTKVPTNL